VGGKRGKDRRGGVRRRIAPGLRTNRATVSAPLPPPARGVNGTAFPPPPRSPGPSGSLWNERERRAERRPGALALPRTAPDEPRTSQAGQSARETTGAYSAQTHARRSARDHDEGGARAARR